MQTILKNATEATIDAIKNVVKITNESKNKKLEARLNDLERQYAILWMTFGFEKIYHQINGSQIAFLFWLFKNNITADYFDIADFCKKQFIKRRIVEDIPLKPWVHFLQSRQIILYENGLYKLTDKGLAFLKYLLDNEYDLKENQL